MANEFLTSNDLKLIKKWIKKLEQKYYDTKKNHEAARSYLKFPYAEIGAGYHRMVFDLKNGYVLKVATTKSGIKNNKNEAEIYRTFNSHLRSNLAKVVDSGYGWIIMEKIDKQLAENGENCDKVFQLRDDFLRAGIRASDIVRRSKREPKWKNLRYREHDKMIIIIDYGPFRYYGAE